MSPELIAEPVRESDVADPVKDSSARQPGVKSARINIQIDLDAEAWEWERHGESGTGEEWDVKPRAILNDVLDYVSGWRLVESSIPGKVTYRGQLIEIDGLAAFGITSDFAYGEEE